MNDETLEVSFEQIFNKKHIVVLDTSVLLKIYDYSSTTVDELLNNFDMILENIWLPAQVYDEFLVNKQAAITRAHGKYKGVSNTLSKMIRKMKLDIESKVREFDKLQYPKVNELGETLVKLFDKAEDIAEGFTDDIKDEVELNAKALREDHVGKFVERVKINGGIGTRFPSATLLDIYDEGERRYRHKIPPGYMDEGKPGTDKYGDLIVWKEILQKVRGTGISVILVTRDLKEDWSVSNTQASPRVEMVREFTENSEGEFKMIALNEFYKELSGLLETTENQTFWELNVADLTDGLAEILDFTVKLDDERKLTSYLIHSGDLQPYIDNPLTDVEVYDIQNAEFNILSFEVDKSITTIYASFRCVVEANVDEYYGSDFDRQNTFLITISGPVEFAVRYEGKSPTIDDLKNSVMEIGEYSVIKAIEVQGYDEDDENDDGEPVYSGRWVHKGEV